MKIVLRVPALLFSVLLTVTSPAFASAQEESVPAASSADAAPAPQTEAERAFAAARAVSITGPQLIPLAGQGHLNLPAHRVFIPQPQAAGVMRAMGNPGDYSDLAGLVFPEGEESWFAVLRFEKSGYIKDDDAKDWDADEMLESYREGTEAANAERLQMGVTPMEIVGWAEKPLYAADTHRLVWAMRSRDKGAQDGAAEGVNYNTFALGREGYFSLNLVTAMATLEGEKIHAHALLDGLQFDEGKRYADFNADTDHVAEYGLAALVLGAGAKKLGLFAVIAAFVAKFAKVFLLVGAGAIAGISKLLKRRKDAQT